MEIAISLLITVILSMLFPFVGNVVGGFLTYLILKKANPDEIKSFKENIVKFAVIAILSAMLFFITALFFFRLQTTLTGQLLGIKSLFSMNYSDKNVESMYILVNLLLSSVNVPLFLFGVYIGSRIIK
jgi:uncharacterized protein YacL